MTRDLCQASQASKRAKDLPAFFSKPAIKYSTHTYSVACRTRYIASMVACTYQNMHRHTAPNVQERQAGTIHRAGCTAKILPKLQSQHLPRQPFPNTWPARTSNASTDGQGTPGQGTKAAHRTCRCRYSQTRSITPKRQTRLTSTRYQGSAPYEQMDQSQCKPVSLQQVVL